MSNGSDTALFSPKKKNERFNPLALVKTRSEDSSIGASKYNKFSKNLEGIKSPIPLINSKQLISL